MLKNYLTIAVKVLARRKFFTFVSLFGISFTLMVLTVASAFVDFNFSPMKPESRANRILYSDLGRMQSPNRNSTWQSQKGYTLIKKYFEPIAQQMPEAIEAFSIYSSAYESSLFHENKKIQFSYRHCDGHFFNIVDLNFIEGAAFTQHDEEQANKVIVINEAVKKQYFGNRSALGKDFSFDGQTYRVVGVVSNVPEFRKLAFADVWLPISVQKSASYRDPITTNAKIMGNFRIAILARDIRHKQAIKAAVHAASELVEFPDPETYNSFQTTVRTNLEHFAARHLLMRQDWQNHFYKEATTQLWIVAGLFVLLFMLMPSLNLVNLNLSRMMERSSEIGVRRAFGAPMHSLMGQFLIENIFLSIVGGAIGLLLSVLVLELINSSGMYAYSNFSVNFRVFGTGFLLTLAFGIISGLYPAWRMARLHPVKALKGSF